MGSSEQERNKPVGQTIRPAGTGPNRKADSVTRALGVGSARPDRGNKNLTHEYARWTRGSQLDGFAEWFVAPAAQASQLSASSRCPKVSDFRRPTVRVPRWVHKKTEQADSRDGPPEEEDDVAGMPDWKPLAVTIEPGAATAVAKRWQRAAKLVLQERRRRVEKKNMDDMLNSVKTILFFNNASILQQKIANIHNKYERQNRSRLLDGKIRPDFVGEIEHIADYWTEGSYDIMQNTLMHGQQHLNQRNADLADLERKVQEGVSDKQLKQDREKLNEQIKFYYSSMELGKAAFENDVAMAARNLELLREEIAACKEQHETNVREHKEYEDEWFDLARKQKHMVQYIEEYEERKKDASVKVRQELDRLRQELALVKRSVATQDRIYKDDLSKCKETQSKIIGRISNKLLVNRDAFLKAHLQRMLQRKEYFDKVYMLKKMSMEKHVKDLRETLDEKKRVLAEATAQQNVRHLWKLALQAKVVCFEFKLRHHELTKDGNIKEADYIERKVWKHKRDPPRGLLPLLAGELDHQRDWLMKRGMNFELDAKTLKCTFAMGIVTPMSLVTNIAGSAMRERENMLQTVQLLKDTMNFSKNAQSKASNMLMSKVGKRRAAMQQKAAAAEAAAAAKEAELQSKKHDMEMTIQVIRGEISDTVNRVLYLEYDEQLHGSDSESDAPSQSGADAEGKRPLPEVVPVMHTILQMENLGRLEQLVDRLTSDWSRWQEVHADDHSIEKLAEKYAEKIADLKDGLKLAHASTHWLTGASLQAAGLFSDIVWKDLKWLATLIGQLKARCGSLRAVISSLKHMESEPASFGTALETASFFLDGLEQLADEEAVDAAEIWMLRLQQGLRKRLDLVKETLDIYSYYQSQKRFAAAGKRSGPELRSVVAGTDTMLAILTSPEVKKAKAQEKLTVAELVGLLHLSTIRLLKDALPDAFRAVCIGIEAMSQNAMQEMVKEFRSGPAKSPEELVEAEQAGEETLPPSGIEEESEAGAAREQLSEDTTQLSDTVGRSAASAPQQISEQEPSISVDVGKLRDALQPVFGKFDVDGSGTISAEEMSVVAKQLKMDIAPERLQEMMVQADSDMSGEIVFGEFVSMTKAQIEANTSGVLRHTPLGESGQGENSHALAARQTGLFSGGEHKLSESPERPAESAGSKSPAGAGQSFSETIGTLLGSQTMEEITGLPTSGGRLWTPGIESLEGSRSFAHSLQPLSRPSSTSFANVSEHSRPTSQLGASSQLGATFTDSFVGEDGFLTPMQDRATAKTPLSVNLSQNETEAPDSTSNSPWRASESTATTEMLKRARRKKLAMMLAFNRHTTDQQVAKPPPMQEKSFRVDTHGNVLGLASSQESSLLMLQKVTGGHHAATEGFDQQLQEVEDTYSRGKQHATVDWFEDIGRRLTAEEKEQVLESLKQLEEGRAALAERTARLLANGANAEERAHIHESYDMQMELMALRRQKILADAKAKAAMRRAADEQVKLELEAEKEAQLNSQRLERAVMTLKLEVCRIQQLATEQKRLAAEEERQAQEEAELQQQLDSAQNENEDIQDQIAERMESLRILRKTTAKQRETLALEQLRQEQLQQDEEEAQELELICSAAYVLRIFEREAVAALQRVEQAEGRLPAIRGDEDEDSVADVVAAKKMSSVITDDKVVNAIRSDEDEDSEAGVVAAKKLSSIITDDKVSEMEAEGRLPAISGDEDEDSEAGVVAPKKMSSVIIDDNVREIEAARASSPKQAAKRSSAFGQGTGLILGKTSARGKDQRPSTGLSSGSSEKADDTFGDDLMISSAPATKPTAGRRKSVFHGMQKPEKRYPETQQKTPQSSLSVGPELGLALHRTGTPQKDYQMTKSESPEERETPQSVAGQAPSLDKDRPPSVLTDTPRASRQSMPRPSLEALPPVHQQDAGLSSVPPSPCTRRAAARGGISAIDKQPNSQSSRVEEGAIEDAVISKKIVDPTKNKNRHQELLDANEWVSSFISSSSDNAPPQFTEEFREGQEEAPRSVLLHDQPKTSSKRETDAIMNLGFAVEAPSALQRMSIGLSHDQQQVLEDIMSCPGKSMTPELRKTQDRKDVMEASPKFQVGAVPTDSSRRSSTQVQSLERAAAGPKSHAAQPSATRMRNVVLPDAKELQSMIMAASGNSSSGNDIAYKLKGTRALTAKKPALEKERRLIMRKSILTKSLAKNISARQMPDHMDVWGAGDQVWGEGDRPQVWDENNFSSDNWLREEAFRRVAEIKARQDVGDASQALFMRFGAFKDAFGTPQDSLMEGHQTTAELSTDRLLLSQEDNLEYAGESLMTLSSGPSWYSNLRLGARVEGGDGEEKMPAVPLPRIVEVRETGPGDPTAASMVDKSISWSAAAVQGARVALRPEYQGQRRPRQKQQQQQQQQQQPKSSTRALTPQSVTPAHGIRLPVALRSLASTEEAAVVSKSGSVLGSPGGWANSLGKDLGYTSPIPPGIVLKTWPSGENSPRPATSDGLNRKRHMMGVGLVNRVI
eukprot:TRINITY_DN1708_c0_g1_i1.p1 TRINITY_DN1708_c0_g1~~TRINITY_DN1708_c0_g1_i1.p1  ORF type:complete len:2490 (-),score=557.78 TRINITY_DN1708_c0_g1_i1:139-7608(-)